eukprot:COSAG04_NODE_31151_length_258_cov_0.918239_2_plen_36_part_01
MRNSAYVAVALAMAALVVAPLTCRQLPPRRHTTHRR